MANPGDELLEMVLRDCGAAGDKPWYPSDYAQATGIERDRLDASLDQLRLAGLVELTEWVRGKGQGYTLTEAGREVLQTPRLLSKIRQGRVLQEVVRRREPVDRGDNQPQDWDRATVIRNAMLAPGRPTVTMTLIMLNVLNFLFGMYLANQSNVPVNQYLAGTGHRDIFKIYMATGALNGRDALVQGEWWRLITCCFVHMGVFHILLNMYVLYSLGPMLEKVWGPVRFALIYLATGVTGSLAAVYFGPENTILAGASGAICGLIGSLLAWVWLNKAYLPNASESMRNIMTNVILIVLISLIPGISAAAHFGGGIAGLVLSVPMNFNRFGKGSQRFLGLAGVLALLVGLVGAGFYLGSPQSELEHAKFYYLEKIIEADSIAIDTNKKYVSPFIDSLDNDQKVTPEQKQETFSAIARAQETLTRVEKDIAGAKTYQDNRINAAIEISQDYIRKWQLYFQKVQELVDEKGIEVPGERNKLASLTNSIKSLQKQLEKSVLVKGQP